MLMALPLPILTVLSIQVCVHCHCAFILFIFCSCSMAAVCSQEQIGGYPTLKLYFGNGVNMTYSGARTKASRCHASQLLSLLTSPKEALSQFLLQAQGSFLKTISDNEFADKLAASSDSVAIVFVAPEAEAEAEQAIAEDGEHTTSLSVCMSFYTHMYACGCDLVAKALFSVFDVVQAPRDVAAKHGLEQGFNLLRVCCII